MGNLNAAFPGAHCPDDLRNGKFDTVGARTAPIRPPNAVQDPSPAARSISAMCVSAQSRTTASAASSDRPSPVSR